MLIFPYQVDIELKGLPVVTISICILCIGVFIHQMQSHMVYNSSLKLFCENDFNESDNKLIFPIFSEDTQSSCFAFFQIISMDTNPAGKLENTIDMLKDMGVHTEFEITEEVLEARLISSFKSFQNKVPVNVTTLLWYNPRDLDIRRMVTSTFSHADWTHLVFNLIFFYAFAVSAELLVGSAFFSFIVFSTCLTTGIIYSSGTFGLQNEAPTLGLSGVVIAIMAMMGTIFPHKFVRCFYWFIFVIGAFRIPLLFLVLIYVGLDIYGLKTVSEDTNVDYLSHLGGAATGCFYALLYLLFRWKTVGRM